MRTPDVRAVFVHALSACSPLALLRVAACCAAACCVTACGTLATSPSWVGGGLAVSAPVRAAEEDAALARERALLASQPKEIGARHILVMHDGSKSKPEGIRRTREEARARAQEALVKVRGGASFDQVVAEYSDEPGAAERGGDLGVFQRGTMVKSFSDIAFSLKIGEVSEVVETPFGFHIIKRTE
ncbi:peptidyl-prolyl cis-trans isomerase [Sorangium cellulosum]|uniref:peptidylprolyl isomerase n=1 Tax=Sorangium cellulosum TaxID=56 RepID=A0A2L0F6W0_SORCE|nr:peptidylprolyl isomerase [Sorangium cellulosum]AUX47257.1 peptidyl-prolyl cis-trans isomerase [Sorangium cellulosum]